MYSNTSLFPSIQFTNNGILSQCWAAKHNDLNTTVLDVFQFNCNEDAGVICRKFLMDKNICNQSNSQQVKSEKMDSLSMLLNPEMKFTFKKAVAQKKKDFEDMFSRIDLRAAFGSLFSTLWYSGLPCYDVSNVTSETDGDKALLRYCSWKGRSIPCSAIFTKFPTDKGLCCAFNIKAAEDIFSGDMYPQMLKEMQDNDNKSAFVSSSLPKWYLEADEPGTQAGLTKGLTVMLDAHTDQISGSSVETGFKGFTGLISYKGSFPLVQQRGFQIRTGHNNLVSLTATVIQANDNIKSLPPWRRNCIFSDETVNLTFHKEYTQSNCFLECSLRNAQSMLEIEHNRTCSPWFFPTYKSSPTVCHPWDTLEFLKTTFDTPDSACTQCLPSCSNTIYQATVTSLPFRRCDDTNLGVSKLCDLEDTTLPEPKMWGQQVKYEYDNEQPDYISNIKTNMRQYLASTGGKGVFKKLHPSSYNAYEEDIAMVQVFFEPSAIFLFGSDSSQTWVDFFATVGGLLGLCIGVSIITIVELLWLCLRLGVKIIEMPRFDKT